jgi:hypothetical protein
MLPGKTDVDRAMLQSCDHGEHKAAYEASRERCGISRESVWIQETPGGDIAVVYMEADDLQGAFGTLGTSSDPFDSAFRDHILEVHGIDLTSGFPPPERALDYRR